MWHQCKISASMNSDTHGYTWLGDVHEYIWRGRGRTAMWERGWRGGGGGHQGLYLDGRQDNLSTGNSTYLRDELTPARPPCELLDPGGWLIMMCGAPVVHYKKLHLPMIFFMKPEHNMRDSTCRIYINLPWKDKRDVRANIVIPTDIWKQVCVLWIWYLLCSFCRPME